MGSLLALLAAVSLASAQTPTAPPIEETLYQAGISNLNAGKLKDAEAVFRKLTKLEPQKPRGAIGLAETYARMRKPDRAIELLRDGVEKNPTVPDYHTAFGNMAIRTKQYDMAIGEFKVAIAKSTDSKAISEIDMRISECYRLKGDLPASIDYMEKANVAFPHNAETLFVLAIRYDEGGRKQDAKSSYLEVLKLAPDNAAAENNFAFLLADGTGADVDAALEHAQKATQLRPDDPNIADTLGFVYLKKHMIGEAIGIFRDNLDKQPNNAIYQQHLDMAMKEKRDRKK